MNSSFIGRGVGRLLECKVLFIEEVFHHSPEVGATIAGRLIGGFHWCHASYAGSIAELAN